MLSIKKLVNIWWVSSNRLGKKIPGKLHIFKPHKIPFKFLTIRFFIDYESIDVHTTLMILIVNKLC